MNYESTIKYLTTEVQSKRTLNTLHRIKYLLEQLDNPQAKLKNVIHITGTNGKGSTAKFISNLLLSKKYQVALFSSPFIIDFRERIQVNDEYINKEDLIKYTEKIKNIIDKYPTTEEIPNRFEVITAIMFAYFADLKADFNIIEVGIGGLFDSTNVIEQDKTVVVTNVALDHQALLGNSLYAIAKQKAGLITNKTKQLILGEEIVDQKIIDIFKGKTDKLIFSQKQSNNNYVFGYQKNNLNTAVTALKSLNINLTDNDIKEAINNFYIPARLEFLADNLIIDGAHNKDGIQTLLNTLNSTYDKKVINLFVGSLAEKNVKESFEMLKKQTNINLFLVNFDGYHQRLGLKTNEYEKEIPIIELDEMQSYFNEENINVVTGSLYFVSEFRKYIVEK